LRQEEFNGTASNTVALRDALTSLGVPKSAVEKTGGGYGQVYSQTSIFW